MLSKSTIVIIHSVSAFNGEEWADLFVPKTSQYGVCRIRFFQQYYGAYICFYTKMLFLQKIIFLLNNNSCLCQVN